jgi:hypothetical protein
MLDPEDIKYGSNDIKYASFYSLSSQQNILRNGIIGAFHACFLNTSMAYRLKNFVWDIFGIQYGIHCIHQTYLIWYTHAYSIHHDIYVFVYVCVKSDTPKWPV